MSAVILLLEVVISSLIVGSLLYSYGSWRQQRMGVTIAAFLSWCLPFLIVCTLPIDLCSTEYRQCVQSISSEDNFLVNSSAINVDSNDTIPLTVLCTRPWLYVHHDTLFIFWRIVYWTSQFLTWVLLPIIQSFARAGDFTVWGKLRTSLIDNAVYYGSFLVLFLILFTYIAVHGSIDLNFANLKVTVISAANTWGLFLVIIFLGSGLVEVPRSLWRHSNTELSLQRVYFKLNILSMNLIDVEEDLLDALSQVDVLTRSIPHSHPLFIFMRIIQEKSCEARLLLAPQQQQSAAYDGAWTEKKTSKGDKPESGLDGPSPSEKQLINLHRRLKKALHNYCSAQTVWKETVKCALQLEMIQANRQFTCRRTSIPSFQADTPLEHLSYRHISQPLYRRVLCRCSGSLEWLWRCLLKPRILYCVSIVLAISSILVIWSECTFFVRRPTLSVFAFGIQSAADHHNFLAIVCISFFTIGYLSFCVYFTVFRLKIFNYFQLVANHQTDENSLIFCGMLLCRLTPPLCLNFLGLVHMDSHVMRGSSTAPDYAPLETSFTRSMGHLDVIPFIARGFNLYFPITLLLLCAVNYLRFVTRSLHSLGFDQFIHSNDDITQSAVEQGRVLLRRERTLIERRSGAKRSTKADVVAAATTEKLSMFKRFGLSGRRTTSQEDRQHLLTENEDDVPCGQSAEVECTRSTGRPVMAPVEYNEEAIEKLFSFDIKRSD